MDTNKGDLTAEEFIDRIRKSNKYTCFWCRHYDTSGRKCYVHHEFIPTPRESVCDQYRTIL